MKRIVGLLVMLGVLASVFGGCAAKRFNTVRVKPPSGIGEESASANKPRSVQSYDFQIGSRLLLKTKNNPTELVGTLVSLNKNSLVLVNDYGAKYELSNSSVNDAYISHGKVSKNFLASEAAGNWALAGVVLGGGIGYLLASFSTDGKLSGLDSEVGTAIKWGGISGIGFGIWGAVIGASSDKEIWKSAPKITVSIPID